MPELTYIFLITFIFIIIAILSIGIKLIVKKNGEFSGTCASQNPFLNKEGEACGFCGALPDEKCKNEKSS